MSQIGKLLILGDSYSTFEGYIPQGYLTYYCPVYPKGEERSEVKQVEQTWWYQLIKETGATLVRNCSFSGTTICHTGYDGMDWSDRSFIARFDRLVQEGFFERNPVDTVIVFGGANDSWAHSPVGELQYGDWTREDLFCVLPAISYLMHRIKTCLPGVRVVCVINTGLKPAIAEGLLAACEHYQVEAVVLQNITKANGHPTIQGMREIAEQVFRKMEEKKTMDRKILSENNPRITFGNVEVFSDNEKKRRSGHLGHAMVECKDGSVLAFYPNVSHTLPEVYPGHSMYGWVEYRRSLDRGITWGEPQILKYSWDEFLEGVHKIGCEKAVVTEDGTIVLFCLRSVGRCFEPYATPTCLRSFDNGVTWTEPVEVSSERGRIYDVRYRDGRIYVLEFCNSTEKGFFATEEGLFYKIFASDDFGASFYEYSVIPFNTLEHTYGNMIFREDGSLVFYSHCRADESNLTCLISNDLGKTWSEPLKSPTAKGARNPQVGYLNGRYILHGRGKGMQNFVFYHSEDAIHWDEGTIVSEPLDGEPRGGCYYSNNIVIRGTDEVDRMLVQYSEQFEKGTGKVNAMHAWVECDDKK